GATAFLEGAEQVAALVVEAPEIRAAARERTSMVRALGPYLEPGKVIGYVVADRRGAVVEGSAGLVSPGEVLSREQFPAEIAARRGEPHAGLPFLGPDGRPHLLVVGQIPGSELYLGLAVAHAGLSAPLLAARAGETGETYALDARGLMISRS